MGNANPPLLASLVFPLILCAYLLNPRTNLTWLRKEYHGLRKTSRPRSPRCAGPCSEPASKLNIRPLWVMEGPCPCQNAWTQHHGARVPSYAPQALANPLPHPDYLKRRRGRWTAHVPAHLLGYTYMGHGCCHPPLLNPPFPPQVCFAPHNYYTGNDRRTEDPF